MTDPTHPQDMQPPSEPADLGAFFRQHRNARWLFVQPGGNWGDHLIYLGAEKIARDAGIEWQAADFRTFPTMAVEPATCIYLHGGGGFNSWGSGRAFDMLERAVTIPDAIVLQGPQTCETDRPDVADRFAHVMDRAQCANLQMLAREPRSWRYMLQHLPTGVPLGLAHDTALALTHADLLAAGELTAPPNRRYDLVIRRRDDEMPGGGSVSPDERYFTDPATFAESFRHWVRIHLSARRIVSNRLHSAIAGAIAGIPTTLLPGSYHKSRSLWEYSLQARGVQWADQALPGDDRGIDLLQWCPPFMRRSWRVQRLAMRLKGIPAS